MTAVSGDAPRGPNPGRREREASRARTERKRRRPTEQTARRDARSRPAATLPRLPPSAAPGCWQDPGETQNWELGLLHPRGPSSLHLATPHTHTHPNIRRPPLQPRAWPSHLGAHPLARGTARARLSLGMSLKHAIPSLICPPRSPPQPCVGHPTPLLPESRALWAQGRRKCQQRTGKLKTQTRDPKGGRPAQAPEPGG